MHDNKELEPLTVTIPVGCKLIGVGNTKFYELINQGKIKTIKIGRRRLAVFKSLKELTNG